MTTIENHWLDLVELEETLKEWLDLALAQSVKDKIFANTDQVKRHVNDLAVKMVSAHGIDIVYEYNCSYEVEFEIFSNPKEGTITVTSYKLDNVFLHDKD